MHSFIHVWSPQRAVHASSFFTTYLHFVISELAWARVLPPNLAVAFQPPGQSSLPLRLTGRAALRRASVQSMLQRCAPHLRQWFEHRWVASHSEWCGSQCAAAIILDGNEKLAPYGCCCATRGPRGDLRFCQRAPRRGRLTCSLPEHRVQDLALQNMHAARLQGRRFLRWLPRRCRDATWSSSAADCNTAKTASARAYHRGGILCATFHCGVVTAPRRFHVAESLPQVAAYLEHLLRCNAALRVVGYDDWCHLEPHLARHGTAAARSLRGYVDRWHARGHRRPQCWSSYSPDRFASLWDWEEHTRHGGVQVRALLQHLAGAERWELHSWSGSLWGSARPSLRLHALLQQDLPLVLSFYVHDSPLQDIRVRSEGGRAKVLAAMRRCTVTLRDPLRTSTWNVDAGAELVAVAPAHHVSGYPQKFLRAQLAAVAHFPLRVILRRRAPARAGHPCIAFLLAVLLACLHADTFSSQVLFARDDARIPSGASFLFPDLFRMLLRAGPFFFGLPRLILPMTRLKPTTIRGRPHDTSLKERQWRSLNLLARSLRCTSPAAFDVLPCSRPAEHAGLRLYLVPAAFSRFLAGARPWWCCCCCRASVISMRLAPLQPRRAGHAGCTLCEQ